MDSIEINVIWSVIARYTANNELGIAAKVAPDQGDLSKPRLICIYTKDFKDMDDVRRVAKKLKDIGLVDLRKPIWYKCGMLICQICTAAADMIIDAYTYLGLDSKNEYGIKASLYSSTDLLNPKEQKKVDGYFYKEKKDTGDWRRMDLE